MAKRKSINTDADLRKAGFRIHARPGTKPGMATWERRGRIYFETVAVEIARRELAELEKALKESDR